MKNLLQLYEYLSPFWVPLQVWPFLTFLISYSKIVMYSDWYLTWTFQAVYSIEEKALLYLFYQCNFVGKWFEEVSSNCIWMGYTLLASDICFEHFTGIITQLNFLIFYNKHCKCDNTVPDTITFDSNLHFNFSHCIPNFYEAYIS